MGALLLALFGLLSLTRPGLAEEIPDHMALIEELGSEAVAEALDQMGLERGAPIHLVPETAHPANWLVARLLERELVARGHTVASPGFGREVGRGFAPGGAVAAAAAPPVAKPSAQDPPEPTLLSLDEEPEEEGEAAVAGEEGEEGEEGGEGGEEGGALEGESPQAGAAPEAGDPAPGTTGVPAAGVPAGAPVPGAGDFEFRLPDRGEVLSYRVVQCGVRYPSMRRAMLIGPKRYSRLAGVHLWVTRLTQPGQLVRASASAERVRVDSFPGWARPLLEGQGFPLPIEAPPEGSVARLIEPVAVAGIVSGLVYLFIQNQK